MKILVFGITGSIGQSLLDVVSPHQIVGASFYHNEKLAQAAITKFKIPYYYSPLLPEASNVKDIRALIALSCPDLIVNAVTGVSGLKYTIAALEAGIDIALANKESLVMAGKFINQLLITKKVKLYPIDSEHSSLYELLMHEKIAEVHKLYITCSGGSCYTKSPAELNAISYPEVIKHPNWNMGAKISFDSATLINKCFEIVECFHLYQTKAITALYHPQSKVHAMVEFKHHAVFAHLGPTDMRAAIKLAINQYKKIGNPSLTPLDFNNLTLHFETIDQQKWKPIQWAYDIINDENNCLGIIINIANEKAIEAFKNKSIKFTEFYGFIEQYIEKYKSVKVQTLTDVFSLIDKLLAD